MSKMDPAVRLRSALAPAVRLEWSAIAGPVAAGGVERLFGLVFAGALAVVVTALAGVAPTRGAVLSAAAARLRSWCRDVSAVGERRQVGFSRAPPRARGPWAGAAGQSQVRQDLLDHRPLQDGREISTGLRGWIEDVGVDASARAGPQANTWPVRCSYLA